MSGAGALVLDVTRTISRAGLGPATGIDRVERAWIDRLLAPADETPWNEAAFAARIGSGTHFVDAQSMADLIAALDGEAAPPGPDLRSLASLRRTPFQRRIESGLRRAGGAPPGRFTYVNLGHANLTADRIASFRAAGAARAVVMIHDAIPLTHPHFARPDGPAKMRERLAAAGAADAVLYNSADTKTQAEALIRPPPPSVVAPLGIESAPVAAAPHDGVVILGTIEPRKNHAMLLDIWADWPDAPILHIVGRRGWMNEDVFARLDARPANVVEHGPLADAEARALLAGARALLMPSFAEGYGLPLAEALALGVPVVASDLPALREVGGDAPLWLAPDDAAGWRRAVAVADAADDDYDYDYDYDEAGAPARRAALAAWRPPQWDDHFRIVDDFLTISL